MVIAIIVHMNILRQTTSQDEVGWFLGDIIFIFLSGFMA